MARWIWVLWAVVVVGCASDARRPEAPASSRPALTLDAVLDGSLVPAEREGRVVARLRVQPQPEDGGRHVPVNLALVIDTSGSMEGKPLADALAASLALLRALPDGDRLAVVTFGSQAELLLPPTELDAEHRTALEAKLRGMRANGTTDMSAGLSRGLDAVQENLVIDGINRVVLLGDGVPNSATQLRALAESARARGISVTTLGLGADYDETLMGMIAQVSGGKFHYVDDSARVAQFFQDEVLRLQGVVARNATLSIVPGPRVRVLSVVGQQATNVGAVWTVELGDVSRGETRELFVELSAGARKDGGMIELCDTVLGYQPASVGERVERRVFLGAHASASASEVAGHQRADVEIGAAFARAAAATLRAIELARSGDREHARVLLETTARDVEEIATRRADAKLREQARTLRALESDLPTASTPGVAPAPGAALTTPTPEPSPVGPAPDQDEHVAAAARAAPKPLAGAGAARLRQIHDQAMDRLQ